MWPRADLTDLLGIAHPIIQAPMAGAGTPELAAAVSNAGGLGSLGCGTMSPDAARSAAEALRGATNRPFNLNFFAHPAPSHDANVEARIRARLAPFYRERGLGEVPEKASAPGRPLGAETLAVVLDLRPDVVSFHFGLPAPEMVADIKRAGCRILCSATNVAEARALEAAGVDAIIAQGFEAGGHRGSFVPPIEDVGAGTMALVPQIVDAVGVPVIAAGGIGDGRGIAAAFALGASGVQMGTAFLSCPEAGISDRHRAALKAADADDTRVTRAFSGRPARARRTRYVEAMRQDPADFPDFPLMYSLSEPLRQASIAADDEDFQFLLYGQAAALGREMPAGDLVRVLADEAQAILGTR